MDGLSITGTLAFSCQFLVLFQLRPQAHCLALCPGFMCLGWKQCVAVLFGKEVKAVRGVPWVPDGTHCTVRAEEQNFVVGPAASSDSPLSVLPSWHPLFGAARGVARLRSGGRAESEEGSECLPVQGAPGSAFVEDALH